MPVYDRRYRTFERPASPAASNRSRIMKAVAGTGSQRNMPTTKMLSTAAESNAVAADRAMRAGQDRRFTADLVVRRRWRAGPA